MLDLEGSNPAKANKILKRLGAQPGDLPDEGNFALPLHEELGLNAEESADRIAEKFSKISQEYPAIRQFCTTSPNISFVGILLG